MRRKRRLVVILILLLAIPVVYRVFGVYKFRSGECRALDPRVFASTYPQRLVVMTYNIEGHAALIRSDHIQQIADVINRVKPDVVCINEAHRNTWQARFHDHVEDLRRLTHMNGVFGRSYDFLGGAFGNIILTRGDVVASNVHDLPGTGEPRSVLEAVVRVNGGTIELYVTHLAAWGSVNAAIRGKQLECLAHHVRASAHPFILAGDLNASPEAAEIAKFRSENVLQLCGPIGPTHKVTEKQLDYVFTDRGWRVVSARALDIGPSDHRPVVVELAHP
ncbi:MAG TPA: endonuclease/exonuclease/phosphatase family protein [Thermoanaerobaculia bacterium]|nr:endonuclease/exonuclease/phosphatase family protein [Thermoanaerobaculia bacterium]